MHPQGSPLPVYRLDDGDWRFSPAVRGVKDDSRAVGPGDLFVAVRGSHDDGHRHLAEAIARGAIAAVVEQPTAATDIPLVAVTNSRRALGEIASAWYHHPSRELELVGVTGTNGKTTVAVMLAAILNAAGRPAQAVGTLGPFAPGTRHPLTTPFPLELQATLRALVQAGTRAVVMEVSSHGLVQHRVAGCEFDAAVLTRLGRDHLDYHGTLKAYWAAKTRLFKLLASAPRHKAGVPTAVLPASGEGVLAVARHVRVPVLRFGLEAGDLQARDIVPTLWGSRFTLVDHGIPQAVSVHLPGRFHVENALAAAAAALALGVDRRTVAVGLDRLRHVPGRAERVMLGEGGFAVIDYAHNPDALASLLGAVRAGWRGRRLVCVFGGRGHRDPGKLPEMGEIAGALADALVLTADSPLDDDPALLAAAIHAGVRPESTCQVEYVPDREGAIEHAIRLAGPGGVVVITGRGHERSQWFADRTVDRSDAEMVRAARERVHGSRPVRRRRARRAEDEEPLPGSGDGA